VLKINQTFTKLFIFIFIAFFVLFISSYFSIKLFLIQPENVEKYNYIWMILGTLFVFILLLLYFFVQSMSYKLSQDVEELHEYLEEVSDKNYEAVIKIRYFQEFLEMSLRLKNIIKRLKNKNTKKK